MSGLFLVRSRFLETHSQVLMASLQPCPLPPAALRMPHPLQTLLLPARRRMTFIFGSHLGATCKCPILHRVTRGMVGLPGAYNFHVYV